MLSQTEIIKKLKQQYPYLAEHYGLKRIGLFGSYAKDCPREDSDIDVVAEFDVPIGLKFVDFTEYLSAMFGKPVDVLTPVGIKTIRSKHIARDIEDSIIYV